MRWSLLGPLLAVLLLSVPARADHPVCIIGRSDCKTIVLAEVSWGYTASHHETFNPPLHQESVLFDMEGGLLAKVAPGHGVGLSLGQALDVFRSGFHLIVRGRYRYWIDRRVGLEGSIAYGPLAGVQAQIAVEALDQVGVFVGVGREQVPNDTTATNLMIGVRFAGFTSIPALFAGYIAALASGD